MIIAFSITTGNYIYIETSSPRKAGEKAKIEVDIPKKGNKFCLSFYYHMYGASVGTLNVYRGNIKVFNVSGNQGNKWIMAKRDLSVDRKVS